MKTPVELPSGQVLDLSRCIILRLAKDNEYELLMDGYQQSIQISIADAVQLKQLLINRKHIPVWSPAQQQNGNETATWKLQELPGFQHSFEELMQSVADSTVYSEAQRQGRNNWAMQKLQEIIDRAM